MKQQDYDIVVSHSDEDNDIVRQLVGYLRHRGYTVWQYKVSMRAGGDTTEVFDIIRNCRYFLIVLSQSSVNSRFVMHELSAAKMREIHEGRVIIIPLLYEDCTTPASLAAKHIIDLRAAPFEALVELENALQDAPTPTSPNASGDVALSLNYDQEADRNPGALWHRSRLDETDKALVDALGSSQRLVLAMDVGGTKAYVCLMTETADRLFSKKFSTEAQGEQAGLEQFIKRCIRESIDAIHQKARRSIREVEDRIDSIGIAFAGPTDYLRGIVLDAPNFSIKDCHLAEIVSSAFGKATFVDNDVNLGVLGELTYGVARGKRNVVGIIIGTGIGGGLALDGVLYRGAGNTAGEIGHIVVDKDSNERCGCGQYGCFEVLASRRAIARNLCRAKIAKGDSKLHWKESNLGSSDLAVYYDQDDPETRECVLAAARVCGKAVFSILNLLNPDMIFFGGGFVRQLGEPFLEPIRMEAKKCMNTIYEVDGSTVPIVLGSLPNPMLVGACIMAVRGSSDPRMPSGDEIVKGVISKLSDRHASILRAIYERGAPTPISRDPSSDFFEDDLRSLRNDGLIATESGLSFRKSLTVHATLLGRHVSDRVAGRE